MTPWFKKNNELGLGMSSPARVGGGGKDYGALAQGCLEEGWWGESCVDVREESARRSAPCSLLFKVKFSP